MRTAHLHATLQEERDALERRVSERTRELARANEELRAADRMKRDFVALISHEMRTPLTVINGFAELMGPQWDQLDADQRSRQVMAVQRNTARLDRLVGNVLQAAALNRDPVTAATDEDLPVDVHGLVMAVVDDAQVPPADVTIDCSSDVSLQIDRAALPTILSHLVTNAREYGAPPIHVTVIVGETTLDVVVSDRGQVFLRPSPVGSSSSSRRSAPATVAPPPVLALACGIARTLARSHGGDLVHVPGGEGATFRLQLGHRGLLISD